MSKLNNQLEVVKEDLEESRNKEELRRLLTDLLEPNCPRLNDPKFVKDMIAFINASHNQSWSTDDEDGSGNGEILEKEALVLIHRICRLVRFLCWRRRWTDPSTATSDVIL